VIPGTGVAPFRADVGLGGSRVVRQTPGGRTLRWQGSIQDLGDLRVYGALETVDASGLFVAPAYSAAAPGTEVTLPPSPAARTAPRIAVGSPARLWILRPTTVAGRYTLVRTVELE
jgi:hypothetical protein